MHTEQFTSKHCTLCGGNKDAADDREDRHQGKVKIQHTAVQLNSVIFSKGQDENAICEFLS